MFVVVVVGGGGGFRDFPVNNTIKLLTLTRDKSGRISWLEVIPVEAESLNESMEETKGTSGDLLQLKQGKNNFNLIGWGKTTSSHFLLEKLNFMCIFSMFAPVIMN